MALASYSDGQATSLGGEGTWASSNTEVATITSLGLATAVAPGTSTITATDGQFMVARSTLTVTPPILMSIAVTPADTSLPKGASQQFTATGTYSDSATADLTGGVTWSSSSTLVATITASGLVTAQASTGASTISATQGSAVGSTTLAVAPAVVVSLSVTPTTLSAPFGATPQFNVFGTYSDGSIQSLDASATWASSDPLVATVSAGMATTVGLGSTTVTATVGANSTTATLTVTKSPTTLNAGSAARSRAGLLGLRTVITYNAVLRSSTTKAALPGQVVAFEVGNATACTATTNAAGLATCSVTYRFFGGAPSAGGVYTANFAETALFLASTGTGVIGRR